MMDLKELVVVTMNTPCGSIKQAWKLFCNEFLYISISFENFCSVQQFILLGEACVGVRFSCFLVT